MTPSEEQVVLANNQVGETYEDNILEYFERYAESHVTEDYYKLTQLGYSPTDTYYFKETGDIVTYSRRTSKWFRVYGTSFYQTADIKRYHGGPTLTQLRELMDKPYFAPFWLSLYDLVPIDTSPYMEQNTKDFMWYDNDVWYIPDGYTENKVVQFENWAFVGRSSININTNYPSFPLQARGSQRCMIASPHLQRWCVFGVNLPTADQFEGFVFGSTLIEPIYYYFYDKLPNSTGNPIFSYLVLEGLDIKPIAFDS